MSVAPPAPIRILILLNRIPYPLNDGGAIGAFNFVKGYAEAGCRLTILAMNTSKHFVEQQKINVALGTYGKVHTVHIDNTIKPLDALLNLLSSQSYIIQRFVTEEFRQKLVEILSNNEFDVVHVDGLPPAAYIHTIRARSKAKISMRAHNVEHVIWQRSAEEEKSFFKRLYLSIQFKRLKAFETQALAKCDVVMAISREGEDTIRACSASVKTIIVPAGMEIAEQPPASTLNQDLFFIGSFDWLPNLQGIEWFFNCVWGKIYETFPSLRLFVAGKKMPVSFSKHKSDKVTIAGEVPDAREFILNHGIMIVPLVSGSGIRIKIVEAMALGKTIIATTIGAEGLGLTNGENILIADTAEEFTQQIGKCLADVSFARRIGENAHRFALENFQNKRIFEKLVNYYRQITR